MSDVAVEYNKFCNNIHAYGNSLAPSMINDCRRFKYHSDAKRNTFKCKIDGKKVPYFVYKIYLSCITKGITLKQQEDNVSVSVIFVVNNLVLMYNI